MECNPLVQSPVNSKHRQRTDECLQLVTVHSETATCKFSQSPTKAAGEPVEFAVPKSSLMVPNQQWYVEDTGGKHADLGQWYLSLRDTDGGEEWVWQPEQLGENMFTVLFLGTSKPYTGFPFAQVQQAYFNPKKDSGFAICMAATDDKKLVVRSLTIASSPDFFKSDKPIYILVDPRFFTIKKKPLLPTKVHLNSESLVVESAMHPGFYLGINWNDIRGKAEDSYSPAVLFRLEALLDIKNKFDLVRLPPDSILVKRLIIDAKDRLLKPL